MGCFFVWFALKQNLGHCRLFWILQETHIFGLQNLFGELEWLGLLKQIQVLVWFTHSNFLKMIFLMPFHRDP